LRSCSADSPPLLQSFRFRPEDTLSDRMGSTCAAFALFLSRHPGVNLDPPHPSPAVRPPPLPLGLPPPKVTQPPSPSLPPLPSLAPLFSPYVITPPPTPLRPHPPLPPSPYIPRAGAADVDPRSHLALQPALFSGSAWSPLGLCVRFFCPPDTFSSFSCSPFVFRLTFWSSSFLVWPLHFNETTPFAGLTGLF